MAFFKSKKRAQAPAVKPTVDPVSDPTIDRAQVLRDLVSQNRQAPDAQREAEIRDLRLAGSSTPGRGRGDGASVELVEREAMPSCAIGDVSPAVVRAAFEKAGCLYIPNVLSSEEVQTLCKSIEQTQQTQARGDKDPAFNNPPQLHTAEEKIKLATARDFAQGVGGCLAVDAPRTFYQCCDMLERHGLVDLARDYLEDAPVFSASKFMLWKVPPVGPDTGWHQDGRFLADMHEIKSMNVWTALTDCGEDAPGMELVLDYLDYFVMPAEDSHFNWSVSDRQVDDFRAKVPVVIPKFKAGDMLLFDHWLLHRTSRLEGMTQQRYAIESWFFAESAFPGGRLSMTA